MAVNKITLKKVVVGTPIKTVTAGSFGIQNLGGVTTTGQASGSILAFNQSTGNYEIANFTGDSNMFVTYDSSSSPDTFQLNFTNDSVSGNLIPRLDSAQDLGSATKKWKDLFLSGGTINIGSLKIKDENGNFVVRDSSGGTVLTNPKFIRQRDSDNILSYDSATSTFTFDDSDVARTNINETFHKNVTISGDLTVSGTTTTVNTETINLADNLILLNSNHTGSPSQDGGIEVNRGTSANKTFVWDETNDRWSVGSETLYSTGLVRGGQVVGDSGTISNLASTTHTASTITANNTTSVNVTSTNLVAGVNATFDSATIGNLSITNMLASSGDSATFTNIANTQFTGSQATIDSATIGNLNADSSDIRQVSTEFINFDSAFGDSATITNLANTQLTASQITADSATINTLNVDSSDVRQISTEFINFDSAFGDSATVTNLATTQLTVANANIDSANITNLSAANFTMSSGDSATITNIANTQLTGSQATLDSATITNLNADSSDIRQLSTEFINFDSAHGDSATVTNIASANINVDQLFTDSATITNIANSVLTAKAITNTTQVGDSATITNIASSQLTVDNATFDSSAHNTIHAGVVTIDSATIGNLATTQITLSQVTADSATINTINADSSDIRQFSTEFINFDSAFGDSATITNIANTQFTSSQITSDSATINTLNVDSSDIRQLSTEFINADSAFIDSATIGGIALGNNDLVTTGKLYYANVFSSEGDLPSASSHHGMFAHVHGTGKGYFAHAGAWHQLLDKSSANDSATITNLANSVLTAKAITGTSANIDSATITNIANSVLTAKVITGDSATVTNIASSQLTGGSASFSGDVILDSSGAIQFDKSDQALEFGDNYKATFGTGGDLKIYHDGANSHIRDEAGTGDLIISTNALRLKSANAGETMMTAFEDGAVNLMHNDATKLSTTATGASITGLMASTTATADSGTIGNLATTQITGSQATFDSADIGNLRTTGVLQADSVNLTQIDVLTGNAAPAFKEGRLFYDDSNKALGFYSDINTHPLHGLGFKQHVRVYNASGSTIVKGKPVYYAGTETSGAIDVPKILLADATDTNKYKAEGLTSGDIANNSFGFIITQGTLEGIDTSNLTAGDDFYVGLTAGALTSTSPLYPNYPDDLGFVVTSDATNGVLIVNKENHTVESLRVVGSGHVGANFQIDGNLTVLGATTSVSSADLTAGTPMFRLNEGNAIGEAGTTFSGTGLDDAFYSGFFTGTANQNYYVRIDGVGTGAGGVDTFEVAFAADSTFSSPVLTKQPITGSAQMIHSTDNISINFSSTTGHDSGARWAGTAGPINVDTGFFSNRNTGASGVGFTYVGIYYDVSDNQWKLIDEYDSNPSGSINEADASYSLGTLKLDTLVGNVTGNVTGNASGTAATVTGAAQTNITSLGTLTGLTVGGDLILDSSGAVVYDKSEQSLVFGDNHKAKFGTGGDLEVYHDGANSYIKDVGTGGLYIRGNVVALQNGTGETYIQGTSNGAVAINHDNAQKFTTTSSGISVNGLMASTTATADSATIGNLAVTNLVVSSGDSATITNIASSSINTNALQVDELTIDADTITATDDFIIDAVGDITLDAADNQIFFKDAGTTVGTLSMTGSDLKLISNVSDKDMIFAGTDGGSEVTALTLDMSASGAATFNNQVTLGGNLVHAGNLTIDAGGDITLDADGGDIKFQDGTVDIFSIANSSSDVHLKSAVQDKDMIFRGNDGGSIITALTLDMSDAGAATFNNTVTLSDELAVNGTGTAQVKINGATGSESVLRFYDGGAESWMLRQTNADNILSFRRSSTNHLSLSASGDVSMAGTLSVGNLNVDSADIIKIARDNLSTANSSALTYDSAGGQFGLNANHVMALIQTVDSNGSGLNAATLDGQEGTHYRINVYNNSGTLLN